MTRTQIANLKRQFIEDRQSYMKKRVTSLEKKLYDKVFNKLISELETSDGKIQSNGKNINLSSSLDSIFKAFNSSEYVHVVAQFGKDLSKITELNNNYYHVASDKSAKEIDAVGKKVSNFLGKRIGINNTGKPVKGGYIDRLISDDSLKNKVKDATLKAITNGRPIAEFMKEMQTLIVGSEHVDGGLIKHFNQYMNDTYNQFDRTASKMYANNLGLTCFIYQGGKIKTSRKFCINHDGKVFTIEEANKWKSKIGQLDGPIADKKTYEPLIDCGGDNCRHSIDFISNSLALRLRPDLEGKI